ncbi:helix-turn-helix domain-containing protein [Nocardia sp. NPDC056100]|uniref:helix-turn-helix domain-containing protein n=1 Tax=Nocardia sp. NPDC056100 TaxID=3345712 RepID=UPI0035D65EE9
MVGSTIPRRAFGRFLRGLREQAGATLLTAGLQIETSKQTVMRLEDGLATKVSTPQLKELLDLYKVGPQVRAEALELWEEVRQQAKAAKAQGIAKGWWQAYADQYAPHFNHYLRLEEVTNHLTTHQLVLVHGLVQTPKYRRAIIKETHPSMSAVNVERRLELAARRQERLRDNDFRLDVMLSEAVLRHQPGGPPAMIEQLRHLATIGESDNVSIRVIPHSVGMYRGLATLSFSLLEFPDLARHLAEPPVVYTEGSEGALYLEQRDTITRFKDAISEIQRVALSEKDSREFISKIAKEYAT